jgi:hypothetical protein
VSERRKPPPHEAWKKSNDDAAKGELERIAAMSDDELDAELRALGIEPADAERVAEELIAKTAREQGLLPGSSQARPRAVDTDEENAMAGEDSGEASGSARERAAAAARGRARAAGRAPAASWRRWVLLVALFAAAALVALLLARRLSGGDGAKAYPSATTTPRSPDGLPR